MLARCRTNRSSWAAQPRRASPKRLITVVTVVSWRCRSTSRVLVWDLNLSRQAPVRSVVASGYWPWGRVEAQTRKPAVRGNRDTASSGHRTRWPPAIPGFGRRARAGCWRSARVATCWPRSVDNDRSSFWTAQLWPSRAGSRAMPDPDPRRPGLARGTAAWPRPPTTARPSCGTSPPTKRGSSSRGTPAGCGALTSVLTTPRCSPPARTGRCWSGMCQGRRRWIPQQPLGANR